MKRVALAASLIVGATAVGVGCSANSEEGSASHEDELQHEVPIDCSKSGANSFDQVKSTIYANDASRHSRVYGRGEMPTRGRPINSFIDILTGVVGKGFSHDLSQILQCTRDYRENVDDHDKVIHAPGICATATWEIDEASSGVNRLSGGRQQPYTGLFAPRTKVNAIVRLSSGTNVSRPDAHLLKASWGIAVKLFPTAVENTDEPVRTVQIVMFDQDGVAGTSSREMLRSEDPSRPHYFINWLFGHDPFALASIATFNNFVKPHEQLGTPLVQDARLQAIDEVARVTGAGAEIPIERAHYPSILKIQLADSTPHLADIANRASGANLEDDFREQLMTYRDGEVQFDVIADNNALGPKAMRSIGAEQKIGRLTLNHMVVSDVCDKQLTFKHRRQGEVFTGWRPGETGGGDD